MSDERVVIVTRVIDAEEPGITCLAVRPGVADTNMQKFLRERGPGAMPPEEAAYYHDLKDQNRPEHPAVPARSIAWLTLHAPREWSGVFMDYDDPRVAEPAAKLYGQAYPQSPQLLQR